jgi:uncharacterized protein YtpQ (UPF0354 family)
VQAASTTFLPVLAVRDDRHGDPAAPVLDAFAGDLAVAYSFGPPWGERLVTWLDLDRLSLSRRVLRRSATDNLGDRLDEVRIDGAGGPDGADGHALTLAFGGLESSLLLADALWPRLADAVPGEIVVGVPARDAVIVTGSLSPPGLDVARRGVDRVFRDGNPHLLTRALLVRRDGGWELFREPVRGPAPRP